MEDSVKIDINNDDISQNHEEENITLPSVNNNENKETENKADKEIIVKDENSISIVLEKVKENDNSNCEQKTQSPSEDLATSKNNSVKNHINNEKGFVLTTSCSVDSLDNLIKSSSGSHHSIENSNKNHESIQNKDNNLNVNKPSKLRPSSLTNFELKDSNTNSSIINDKNIDQIPPLKTKRPSLNFIKHITGFSETYKLKTKKSTKEENKMDTISSKKSGSIKKVIIRSDSNIIGHFENVIVKEKRGRILDPNIPDIDIYNKKVAKNLDDNPTHTVSLSDATNITSHNHILSSSFVVEHEMNNMLSRPYSKSVPITMNYISNDDNIDIIDQKYESKPIVEENVYIDSSNGNINYNDFLFSDDEVNENGDQNASHDASKDGNDPQKEKKKAKANAKNVTFNESECDYIPNIYEIHITEESELYCTKCKKKVNIEVKREYSKTFWIIFIILLICGVIFAWIPFLFNRFKYYSFYCKICKKRILKLQQAADE